MTNPDVKRQVADFYDQVGWQTEADGLYQNARYEDLRPVASEYIHRCHIRIKRYIKPQGRLLLDAGSGPVQYPEYRTYSEGYAHRVCADISIVALKEARQRLGEHGLYVVCDVARLPFAPEVFDGVVSLHTLHHLPVEEQPRAYRELHRVLAPNSAAAIVNGWTESALMQKTQWLVRLMEWIGRQINRRKDAKPQTAPTGSAKPAAPTGTFVRKLNAEGLRRELGGEMDLEILVWRSVSVRWLRAVIHRVLGGKLWLRLLYALEERWPHWFGEKGQYPLVVIRKQ